MGWNFVQTDAKGYHDDLKQAVKNLDWMGPILTMRQMFSYHRPKIGPNCHCV